MRRINYTIFFVFFCQICNSNDFNLINSSWISARLLKSSNINISRRVKETSLNAVGQMLRPWVKKIKEGIYSWPSLEELSARGEGDKILLEEGRKVYAQYFSTLREELTKVREELAPVLEKIEIDITELKAEIDTYPEDSGAPELEALEKKLDKLNEHRKLVGGIIRESQDPLTIRPSDEYVYPLISSTAPVIKPGDLVIDTNWRADRRVEMHYAASEQFLGHSYAKLSSDPFKQEIFDILQKHLFSRQSIPQDVTWVPLALYDDNFTKDNVVFPPITVVNPIGGFLSSLGISQVNIAESEKYNHVTRFFNGDTDEKFPGQDTVMINSPTDVDTYDQKPEMSAPEVARETVKRIESGKYGFVFVNFANPDIVGHTGNFPAVVKAVEAVDRALGEVVESARKTGYAVVILADHGNAEEMFDKEGNPRTAHTTNKVPFIIVTPEGRKFKLKTDGVLGNFAPTVLDLLGIEDAPPQMIDSLIEGDIARKYKGVVGVVLDGWGVREETEGNAILAADIPNFDRYKEEGSYAELEASGEGVGLTKGDMGNSEVGHMNIGAGYIVEQQFSKILRSIKEGWFFTNDVLVNQIKAAVQRGGDIHIMGLLSDGNIHSAMQVWYALLELARRQGVKVYLHPFLDGKDSPPKSAARTDSNNPGYLLQLQHKIDELGVDAQLATLMGRNYAMDRDMRWVRIFIALNALFKGVGVPIEMFK